MRFWYINNFGYIPDRLEIIEWLEQYGYDANDLIALDTETMLELYYIEND